jgi:hypothetical protein
MATTFTPQLLQNQVFYAISGGLPGGPAADPVRVSLLAALQQQLPQLWDLAAVYASPFAAYPGWFVLLQIAYCKRLALNVLWSQLSVNTDQMLGRVFRASASQLFKNVQQIQTAVTAEIKDIEGKAKRNVTPSVGMILQTAPVMRGQVPAVPDVGEPTIPCSPYPDANSPVFSGDPYRWARGEGPL